jgi:beta-xylosidase
VPSLTGVDYFAGPSLGPQWEWNHNPDTSKFAVQNGLTLTAATVTPDLYSARNTLSHRILGPVSTATIKLNYGSMLDGDRAGLAMLRDVSAWVGVRRDGGAYTVAAVSGLSMNGDWSTRSTGSVQASAGVSGGSVYLRATADIKPGGTGRATFSYSTDGATFSTIGPAFAMNTTWNFFMGYRFAIFNHATSSLGGKVSVPFFQLDAGSGSKPPTGTTTATPTATVTATTTKPTTTTTTSTGGGGGGW